MLKFFLLHFVLLLVELGLRNDGMAVRCCVCKRHTHSQCTAGTAMRAVSGAPFLASFCSYSARAHQARASCCSSPVPRPRAPPPRDRFWRPWGFQGLAVIVIARAAAAPPPAGVTYIRHTSFQSHTVRALSPTRPQQLHRGSGRRTSMPLPARTFPAYCSGHSIARA